MQKILLILITLSIPQICFAYDEAALVAFYREFYREEMAIGFFQKEYRIKSPDQRKRIIDYIKKNNREASQEEIENAWQAFLKNNFKNPLEINTIIEKSYIDLDTAKNKFIEDLDLEKYFDIVVAARIKKDLREKAEILPEQELKVTDLELVEAKEQLKANYGSDIKLTDEDIEFLIKTSL